MENKVFKRMTSSLAILIMVTLIGSACTPAATPQPTEDRAAKAAFIQQTLDTLRSQLNQTATAEKNVLIQQVTSISQTQTATVTPIPTSTFTSTPNLQTQQASAMFLKIQQYASNNYLPSTSGTYQHLFDQVIYYSNINHYKWTDSGLELDDFALESDLAWENSTKNLGNSQAGCGFIFHADERSNYSMAYFGLDGYVYLDVHTGGETHPIGRSPFGNIEVSKGNAHIALVVNGNHYAFFVNEKMILQSTAESDSRKTGGMAYLVFSGSNKNLGTICKFTNVVLWKVKPLD